MFNAIESGGNPLRKKLTVGMLAHVDAGKTTLAEALLFFSGALRKLGRVDHKNAFLDIDAMERQRGITIFSKQAILGLDDMEITLLDTPGHVDFASEMERTLQVLDYAVLVISAAEGIQGHTVTLWNLLARYAIPTFIFVNKMDMPTGIDPQILLETLESRLHNGCVSFSEQMHTNLQEQIALCDEDALSEFLEQGFVKQSRISLLIQQRRLFPCYFGSALKLEGIDALLAGIQRYASPPSYREDFSAKVYKITRDKQNNRLTHLKITGGSLSVKEPISGALAQSGNAVDWTEKVNQIRLYSGEKYTAVDWAGAGTVCAVTGLSQTYPGQSLGAESPVLSPVLEPVLSYRVLLPQGCVPVTAFAQLRILQEEDPLLRISWNEQTQEIHAQVMGQVQLEYLSHTIQERFGIAVSFQAGRVLYYETIAAPVVGSGHFEPLRHYAEVHLLLMPAPRGSGIILESRCAEERLAGHWQRLILSHLQQRKHPGVRIGAPLTDVKITLLSGRAHPKHTEGGDFRQATYRALRQGLMQADCVLLEPWYRFTLEVPHHAVGRAMNDLQRMTDQPCLPETAGDQSIFTGCAPVAQMQEYAAEVMDYTRGMGRLSCSFSGFAPCLHPEEAAACADYDPAQDTENPADSVFCEHGTSFTVRWDQVKAHMHVDVQDPLTAQASSSPQTHALPQTTTNHAQDNAALDAELQAIFERTYGPAKPREVPQSIRLHRSEQRAAPPPRTTAAEKGEDYLLVDGYNIIHAWEELAEIAQTNLDTARQMLIEQLSGYQALSNRKIILVFDAYRVTDGQDRISQYHNVQIVYTKEAETADAYIEKVSYRISQHNRVSVATSDAAIQYIILGHGALRMTPQALQAEIEQTYAAMRETILQQNNQEKRFYPFQQASEKGDIHGENTR